MLLNQCSVQSVLKVGCCGGDDFTNIIALRGDEQLALAVEKANQTIELAADDYLTRQTATGLVSGSLRRDGTEIKILNLKELFPAIFQRRERRRRRFQNFKATALFRQFRVRLSVFGFPAKPKLRY
jgi:hypothetical protein